VQRVFKHADIGGAPGLGKQQCLDRAALVHGRIALGDLIEPHSNRRSSHLRYCSSPTCSTHLTFLPPTILLMAIWLIEL
jgi:hypothetical protein